MNNKNKRAIILDLDGTLENQILSKEDKKEYIILVRPNLAELAEKLKETKAQKVDIILCTTATKNVIKKFFEAKPELESVFDRIISKEEIDKIYIKQEKNQELKDYLYEGKPIDKLGYEAVLYVDDNKSEEARLQKIVQKPNNNMDISYFSGFGFYRGIDIAYIHLLKQMKGEHIEEYEEIKRFLQEESKEPGCKMMCSSIDYFVKKEYKPGLTVLDEEYSLEYKKFEEKRDCLEAMLFSKLMKLKETCGIDVCDGVLSETELERLTNDLNNYDPNRGITNKSNKDLLVELVNIAKVLKKEIKRQKESLKDIVK